MSEQDRIRWDERWGRHPAEAQPPSNTLLALDGLLPRSGRALDLAGGSGRHAIWLARRGLQVTLADVSGVGLDLARQAAEAAGVELHTVRADLETEPPPAGPWDLVLVAQYLQRSLFPQFPRMLAPGGLLVYIQPTVSNLQRHQQPSRRFLLDDGELPRLVVGLDVLRHDEGWLEDGRHEARLVARKP